jgi:D-3-phosphoglycerate dehydrogenase / 2-oxoglutarate reductase
MPTVILCRPLHDSGMKLLNERGDITVRQLNRPAKDELVANVSDAAAVVVGLEQVDDALLSRAPELKIVSRFGVGYDTVDIPACTRKGVVVAVTNGANDLAVAEHTMMLMLAVARRTIEMDASVRAGSWMIREGRPMGELSGRRVLVVGYGRIGTRVARLCQAFGMITLVCDPAFPVPRIAADGHIPVTDIAAALPGVDVVTLHSPLGDETHHLMNREMLGLLPPHAWLINAARGPLVDESALYDALSSGRLAAAGLDVLMQEPAKADNPLFRLKNVVLSPHNAAAPIECFEKMSVRAARSIIEMLDGVLDPGFVVNPETLPNRRNV